MGTTAWKDPITASLMGQQVKITRRDKKKERIHCLSERVDRRQTNILSSESFETVFQLWITSTFL